MAMKVSLEIDRIDKVWMEFALQSKISMHLRILHLLPDLVTNHINLLFRVLERLREDLVGEGLETLHDLQVIPGADFFL